jgi:mRNA-degrading endonuclease RelE of RelBE toxin-antitoxin system
MAYAILIHELALEEIRGLRVFDQRKILDSIDEQLSQEPTVPTRRRKCLEGVRPEFEHALPVWELRIGKFRAFYDVDAANHEVHIRAVRRKDPSQQTKDIT